MMEDMKTAFPSIQEIDDEIRRAKAGRHRAHRRRIILLILLIAVIAGTLISMRYVSFLKIGSNGMETTLRSGDIALYRMNGAVNRGDIAVIGRDGELLVKRVIGIPGDQIRVTAGGDVYVNGAKLQENYVEDQSPGNSDVSYPVIVAQDSYFVMGDHRSTSLDSRSSAVGLIAKDEIKGIVRGVIWPAYRIGTVE